MRLFLLGARSRGPLLFLRSTPGNDGGGEARWDRASVCERVGRLERAEPSLSLATRYGHRQGSAIACSRRLSIASRTLDAAPRPFALRRHVCHFYPSFPHRIPVYAYKCRFCITR